MRSLLSRITHKDKNFLYFDGKQKGEADPIIMDYKVRDYGELIDLFPAAAYPNAHAKEVLEQIRTNRTERMGYEVYPEKDHLGTHVVLYRGKNGPYIRVVEHWKDRSDKGLDNATIMWDQFSIDERQASKLKDEINSLKSRGSSPESEV